MSGGITGAVWYGFGPPFIGGQEGIFSRQVDEKLIKNDLLQLLLTAYGERVMRPSFGSPVRTTVFENMTTAEITAMEDELVQIITEYEPRVVVSSVDITIEDDNTLNIKVYGSLNLDINNVIARSTNTNFILVELNLPTNPRNQAENSGVAGRVTT